MKLFGFELRRAPQEVVAAITPSFVPPNNDEGGVVVAAGGSYGTVVDIEGVARSESELIIKYRDMAIKPEIEPAIDEITNEAVIQDPDEKVVELILDDVPLSDNIKEKIIFEFEYILKLLNFNQKGNDWFRQWYIDGRLFFHALVNINNTREGITELRYIDAPKLKKVRQPRKQTIQSKIPGTANGQANTIQTIIYDEFFVYFDKGLKVDPANITTGAQGIRIANDSIIYSTSGLTDKTGQITLSYLHKAIKPLNQLNMLEDAAVIYRLARAPERRIFYIDVGNLPKIKAEQYLRDMMNRHKNKLVYDQNTGEVKDDRKFMTMLEDYWLPRREGGKGTEIDTLPGGTNLGEMTDVEYFKKKLYNSLNVPTTRLDPENVFTIGRATEITRDEIKFYKFIVKLRNRFSMLFLKALEKQVVLKNIMQIEEWQAIENLVRFKFNTDNHFFELKDMEMLSNKLSAVEAADPFVGKYLSRAYINRQIFRFSDQEQAQIQNEIQNEVAQGLYLPSNVLVNPENPAGNHPPSPGSK